MSLGKASRPESILEEEGLKFDREGQRRTTYSLRHTYIAGTGVIGKQRSRL
jgi:hypothetical protein